ncbi:hypothetical protein NN561_008610 [Cricetulus griseus]
MTYANASFPINGAVAALGAIMFDAKSPFPLRISTTSPKCGELGDISGIALSGWADMSTGKTRALEGDLMTLHCKSLRGSPHIQYEFYYEDVFLDINSMISGGGASFNFSMTTERSGNYYCTADNGLGAQRSEAVRISVIVPVSRPVLTLKVPGAQAVVGDVVELHCEALGGSPPILYHFYHQNVTLGSSLAPSGGRGSFNFSVTAEHSGNFFCEADNGRGPQRSDILALSVIGGRPTSDDSRFPKDINTSSPPWMKGSSSPIALPSKEPRSSLRMLIPENPEAQQRSGSPE